MYRVEGPPQQVTEFETVVIEKGVIIHDTTIYLRNYSLIHGMPDSKDNSADQILFTATIQKETFQVSYDFMEISLPFMNGAAHYLLSLCEYDNSLSLRDVIKDIFDNGRTITLSLRHQHLITADNIKRTTQTTIIGAI